MRIKIARAAQEDLKDIWDRVSTASSDAIADGLVHRIRSATDRLAKHPHAGRPRDDLVPGLRTVREGSYLAFYVVEADRVIVTRVVHGARDLRALAAEGRLA